jgi:hydrogenase nickel incorporation protein HypA/HybF
MHEMSLCEGILQILEDEARTRGFQRVRTVVLDVGALAAVEVDALRFCFEVVCREGVARGAQLRVELSPGRAWCAHCGDTVAIAQRFDACPVCGAFALELRSGDALRIKDIEVE